MNAIQNLGFNNWFKDKVDLSKTTNFKIVRVISVNKNSFVVSNGEKDICGDDIYNNNFYSTISLTRPTSPVSSRTFIPCGCLEDFVRISLTIPSVRLPVRWSSFNTIFTCIPVFISDRLITLIKTPSLGFS
jgi:hypothetical protein